MDPSGPLSSCGRPGWVCKRSGLSRRALTDRSRSLTRPLLLAARTRRAWSACLGTRAGCTSEPAAVTTGGPLRAVAGVRQHRASARRSTTARRVGGCCAPAQDSRHESHAARLRVEQRFPLGPLALPESHQPAAVADAPATALFVACANGRDPSFRLSVSSAGALATVCACVGGVPLAIELAAARTSTLSVQEIADRLDHVLNVLGVFVRLQTHVCQPSGLRSGVGSSRSRTRIETNSCSDTPADVREQS